jgi:hypothetical protein
MKAAATKAAMTFGFIIPIPSPALNLKANATRFAGNLNALRATELCL